MNSEYSTPDNTQPNDFPLTHFEGEVVVVDTPSLLEQATGEIARLPAVGFDTESRPSFKRGETHSVALIQFATDSKAWLVRTCKLGLTPSVIALLESGTPTKIGASLRDDTLRLHALSPFTPHGFFELQTAMQQIGIKELSVRKMAERLLGFRISKRQQLSNWENDALTEAQQRYAATDAWVCYRLYHNPLVQSYLHTSTFTNKYR